MKVYVIFYKTGRLLDLEVGLVKADSKQEALEVWGKGTSNYVAKEKESNQK